MSNKPLKFILAPYLLLFSLSYADDLGLDLPVEPCDIEIKKPKPIKVVSPEKPPPPKPPAPTTPLPPPEVPPTFYGKDIQSETGSVIYVIDISGSMNILVEPGKPLTRMDRAKTELKLALRSLPQSFKFNILAYDCETRYFWSGGGAENLCTPATSERVAQAGAWVDALTPGGATGTGPAVVWALMDAKNKLILLLTDGAPNCGAGRGWDNDPDTMAAHLSQVFWKNGGRVRIDVFGVSALGAFRSFCVSLASQNRGTYTDVK